MIKNAATPFGLVLAAFALPAVGLALPAPANAQSGSESTAAREIAENLVNAINGRRSARRNWGYRNLASERLRDSQIAMLDTLAVRRGELTLTGVSTAGEMMIVAVQDARGRTGAIRLLMDNDRPDKVLSVSVTGF